MVRFLASITFMLCLTVSTFGQDIERRQPVERVLTLVPSPVRVHEAFSIPQPFVGIKAKNYKPNYQSDQTTLSKLSSEIVHRYEVGGLEFSYKPLRTAVVEVPANGGLAKKTVHYLIYRVRNRGNHVATEFVENDLGYQVQEVKRTDQLTKVKIGKFSPHIVLEGWYESRKNGRSTYYPKSYLERFSPSVVRQLEKIDRTPAKLHGWNDFADIEIAVDKDPESMGTWGVAYWEDVDPRINYYSVYVQGLTNAFTVNDRDGKPVFKQKTLQLNFWRPGDATNISEDTIYNGIPLQEGNKRQSTYCRFYALPGPAVEGFEKKIGTENVIKLFEIDANFDRKFNSLMLKPLNEGTLPKEVIEAFAKSGIKIPDGAVLDKKIDDTRWEFKASINGEVREFRIDHRPRYWEKRGREIFILKQVDNLWIFR